MSEAVERLNAALEGRYRIEREIGEGGMATVYLAHDVKHERKVALKVLKPELAAVVGADRFLAEIKTMANLQHPHILPLHDSGEADGFLFYVMPYVGGESLRERLDREHQLPVDEAVQIARDVAGALDYAHRQGVIHRDIKPANVLMLDGKPVVSDFGIALAVGAAGGGRLTETGLSLGTPHYMSPEQATGDQAVDARADVYSLGCVVYEMLGGEPPHQGRTPQAILASVLTDTPKDISRLRPAVSRRLADALARSLERIPADRFQSAGSFGEALDSGVDTLEVARGWRVPMRLLAVTAVVGLVGFGLLRLESDEISVVEGRVIVLPFENRANDPQVVQLAIPELATEWMTAGLGRAGFEVVPTAYVAGLLPTGAVAIEDLVRTTGASVAVSGSVLRQADSVFVSVEIVDGRSGRLLFALSPAAASLGNAMPALERALERASGALASHFDFPAFSGMFDPPPSLELHRLDIEATRLFERELFEEVIAISNNQRVLDSTYLMPLLRAAWANFNLGRRGEARALLDYVEERPQGSSALFRADVATLSAMVDGRTEELYLAAREYGALDPDNWMVPLIGARASNRLEEALEYAARFDPTLEWNRLEAYEWASFQSHAWHGLGLYHEELAAYRDAAELDAEQLRLVSEQVDALIALGRVEEVRRLMDEFEGWPRVIARYDWDTGTALQRVALEARAHGYPELANEALGRALAYFRSDRGRAEWLGPESRDWRFGLGRTLYRAGEFEEAIDILSSLVSDFPGVTNYWTYLGASLAKHGQVEEAESWLARLRNDIDQTPDALRAQARLLSALGREDEAVTRLADAFRAGLQHSKLIHRDWDFIPLADHPAFVALTAPR